MNISEYLVALTLAMFTLGVSAEDKPEAAPKPQLPKPDGKGNPIEHYGDLDVALNKFKSDQTGPIKRFMS